jgi:hypothetical protein
LALVATFVKVTFAAGTALPCGSVMVPIIEEVPVCAHAQETDNTSTTKQTRELRFTESHLMDCSFRTPLPEIEIHAGGQHQADTKTMRRVAGSQPGKEFDLEQLPHHLKQPLT